MSTSILSRFHVVVVTGDYPRSDILQWNDYCHQNGIVFIASNIKGAAGYCFSDFGTKHIIKDPNGENTKSAVVVGVAKGKKTIIYTIDTKRHGFDDGDYVHFREIEGMTNLNDGVPRRITNCKAHSFELENTDSSDWPEYTGNGVTEQVKVPVTVSYEPLSVRITNPVPSDEPMGFITPDLGKFGRSEQLHTSFQAIELYRSKHGKLPAIRDNAAADECVTLAKEWLATLKGKEGALALDADSLDAQVVKNVALLANTELPALCAFFGGVVAQEVVKVTGKFTPIRQYLYLDAFEVLPDVAKNNFTAEEFAPQNNRYDNLVAILGRTQQTKMMNQRVFVVGAGALGCEFLKNFALMGVGCGPSGRVTVTDMDRIEVSNLNRQFLFRSNNIGEPKSVTAAAAARAMNNELKIEALETPVGEDTESTFNDAFWNNIDIVTNALDNIKARQYVDGRCVFYGKALMESGTLGTKANTQVVVPFMTESYSDSQDPPEDSIPMCTLRNFPHAIEHCIEWARDLFQGSFNNTVQDAAAFVANPSDWLAKANEEANFAARRAKLEGTLKCLEASKGASYTMCVDLARHLFNQHFYLQIRQLLHNFPPDYTDKDTGMKFWSGPKRAPTPAMFDIHDPLHFGFVAHATALIAANYNVQLPAQWDSPANFEAAVSKIQVPDFQPKNVHIKSGENDKTEEGAEDDRPVCDALVAKLSAIASNASGLSGYKLTPAEFEKDDDSNHHIDFITAASNLRARNYKIKETTFHEVKMIAGKIIPAIATTTCAITGLVCIELYKTVAKNVIEAMRNSFLNLAVNVYSMGEPLPPRRNRSVENDPVSLGPVRAYPEGFSRWDKFIVKAGNLTCKQFDEWLQKEHKIELSMITAGKFILYNPTLYRSHAASRGNMTIVDVWKQVTNQQIPAGRNYLLLDLSVTEIGGASDVTVPQCQYFFAE